MSKPALIATMLALIMIQQAKAVSSTELPADVAIMAWKDCQRLDGNTQKFTKYIWCDRGVDLVDYAVADLSLNMLGHDSNIFQCRRIGFLLRLDYRLMVSDGPRAEQELAAVRDAFERIIDPAFHIQEEVIVNLIQVDTEVRVGREVVAKVKAGDQVGTTGKKVEQNGTVFVEVFVEEKGKRITGFVKQDEIQEKIVQQRFGLGSFAEVMDQLSAATQSRCPVITLSHFLATAMCGADPGIAHEPLYLAFKDLERLDLKDLFARYRLRIEDTLDFNSGAWAATRNSKIHGKSRIYTAVIVPTIRLGAGFPVWHITMDFADEGKAEDEGFINLLNPRPVATEIVMTQPNGLFGYAVANLEYDKTLSFFDALRDGKIEAKIQGEVGQNIAWDRKLRDEPHPTRLIVGMSCANCHGKDRDRDGLQPFDNEVLKLTRYRLGSPLAPLSSIITGDESGRFDVDSTLKTLSARYYLDPNPILDTARTAHRITVARLTAVPGKIDGYFPYEVYNRQAEVFQRYLAPVTRRTALRECAGVELGEGDNAEDWFNAMFPILPPNEFGVSPEHLNIASLRAGINISRKGFNLVKPDMYIRAVPQVIEFRKQLKLAANPKPPSPVEIDENTEYDLHPKEPKEEEEEENRKAPVILTPKEIP